MTMKKILAGIMAAATMMTVSAVAFASAPAAPDKTKELTKPGENEYEVGVSAMQAELSVELPGNMKAFINPYGAEVNVDAATTPTKAKYGVLSWAYEIVNNTEDFGIMIDVKNGKAEVSDGITLTTPAASLDDKKIGIGMASAADAATLFPATFAAITANAKATASAGGKFVFTTTATNQAKFAYAPAKTTSGAGKVYIGFQGIVGTKYATADASKGIAAGDPVEWTSDDSVTCTFVLKINPSAKTAAAADFT